MATPLQPFSAALPVPLVLETADVGTRTMAGALCDESARRLQTFGCALLAPQAVAALTRASLADLNRLAPAWNDLPPDEYLKDGGHYRSRRHGSFLQTGPQPEQLTAVPHRAHWQPTTYNALHGGMLRWFAPLQPAMSAEPAFLGIVSALGELFGLALARKTLQAGGPPTEDGPWFIEVHPFRIDTAHGVGRPTPEGAHRDGVDYVAVILVERQGVRGGETRVFQADNPLGLRFTLREPWTALLLDDPRVIHETTPLLPDVTDEAAEAAGNTASTGHRDTLVITYRRGGFQDPV